MCQGGCTADDSVTVSSRPTMKDDCMVRHCKCTLHVHYMYSMCAYKGAFSQLHISSTER